MSIKRNISPDLSTKIIINKHSNGFLATCSSIQGVSGRGDSQFEALYSLLDNIHLIHHHE